MKNTVIDFQPVTEEDYVYIKEVYDYYISNSTATFHLNQISIGELKEIIPLNHPVYKGFLIMFDGRKCGYCYIGQYKKRDAYNRTAELSLYLEPSYHGRGFGKQAIEFLIGEARKNNLKNLIAIVTAENESSARLFISLGFEQVAHFKKVGEKFGRILDVLAFQMEI